MYPKVLLIGPGFASQSWSALEVQGSILTVDNEKTICFNSYRHLQIIGDINSMVPSSVYLVKCLSFCNGLGFSHFKLFPKGNTVIFSFLTPFLGYQLVLQIHHLHQFCGCCVLSAPILSPPSPLTAMWHSISYLLVFLTLLDQLKVGEYVKTAPGCLWFIQLWIYLPIFLGASSFCHWSFYPREPVFLWPYLFQFLASSIFPISSVLAFLLFLA